LAAFGLFETDIVINGENWGQGEAVIWGRRNLNLVPQKGDHDAGFNEMGWDIVPATSISYAASKNLWDTIMVPLQPPSIANRATANHWSVTLGALTFVAPDGITLASGDGNDANIASSNYGPTTIYSNNQIDDCLDALNTDTPFKILGLAYSIKFMDATHTKFFSGAQNPLKNARLSEFQRFFTKMDDTVNPLSVMANAKTNGTYGTCITMHGDYHVNEIAQNQATAYTGNHAENFYSFTIGTSNGSVNFGVSPGIDAGTVYDGSTIEVIESASKGLQQNGGGHWWSMRIDINDATYPPEMTITDKDRNDNVTWSKRFTQYRGGNYAFNVTDDISDKCTGISSSYDVIDA